MGARKVGGARASRVGALGFTAAALVFTGLTALLLAKFMSGSKYASEPMRSIVVAAVDIPAVEEINEDHLRLAEWPASAIPEGAFETLEAVLGPALKSRVPTHNIYKGEPILEQRLSQPEAGTGMASLVHETLRAFPIPVDNWIADARLVYPGAIVDVLATLRDPINRRPTTKLVLQAIRVLAVDGNVDPASRTIKSASEVSGSGRKTVVTLLVSAEQAESLALSSREGRVDLMLRNTGDMAVVDTFGVSPGFLLGLEDPEDTSDDPPPAPVKRARRRRRPARPSGADRAAAIASDGPSGRRPSRVGRRGNVKTITLEAK